jgi:hypothetical protein
LKKNSIFFSKKIEEKYPWVFPFVRHGDDIAVVEVSPLVVSSSETRRRRHWLIRVAVKPILDDVVEKLSTPQHSGVRLTLNVAPFSV